MAYTNYRAVGPVAADLYRVDSAPEFALGTVIRAVDPVLGGGEFIYLRGAVGVLEGSWVTYREKNNTAVLLAANAIGSTAVAMAPVNLATSFGWFQIRGKAVGLVAAGFPDDGAIYATATAGTAAATAVAGDRVKCARGCSAIGTPAAGVAYADVNFPYMDDGLPS